MGGCVFEELFYRSSLQVLVVDEGHRLKNTEAKLYQKLFGLKTNFRILLTGCAKVLFFELQLQDTVTK